MEKSEIMSIPIPKEEEKEEKPKRTIQDCSYPEMMLVSLRRISDFPYKKRKQIIDGFDKYWNLIERNIKRSNDDSDAVVVKESKDYNSVLKELKDVIKKIE